jgi:hypothetical protein
MKSLPGALCAGLLVFQAAAQVPGPEGFIPTEGMTTKKIVATSITGSIYVLTAIDSYFTWWKNAEKPFSFFTEHWINGSQRGIDKFGHMFGTYALLKSIRTTLLWGGCQRSTALWWGAGIAAFNAFEIEVGDGFSPYGFDYQDLVFGFSGIAFGMLQTEVPFLRNFDLKFSYYSNLGPKTPASFVEDYDAMTIWCSVNVHNLMPESIRSWWPKFLNLAIGYGVDDNHTRREFVIGFDINLEAFETSSEDLLYAERVVNLMHLPSPAIKWTEGRKPQYYLLHFK